jgi:YD repeat-containing protein
VNGQAVTERWVNDALGRVKEYTDGAGRKWAYTYNKKSTIEKTPLGLERTYTYNSRKDLVSVREADTVTGEVREQTIVYDKRHLAVKVRDGAGGETEYGYRDDGLMAWKKQGAWKWEYAYDAGGRLISVTRRMEGSAESYTEEYGYSRSGAEETRSVITPGGSTAYRYDPWGRVPGVTNAAGEVSSRVMSSAGRVVKEQGASGGNFAYSYDNLGRIIGAGRENDTAVQALYNSDGTMAEQTDRNGVRTVYSYDGRGLLVKEAGQQGETSYQYDGAGRVIYREIKNSNTGGAAKYYTGWEYNDAARTVKVTEGGLYAETWGLNAWEEAIQKTDGEGNGRSWRYDGAGRLAASIDGYGKETAYAYNAIGKIARVTYPDGSVTAYEYNHLGQAVRITDGEGIQWEGGYGLYPVRKTRLSDPR